MHHRRAKSTRVAGSWLEREELGKLLQQARSRDPLMWLAMLVSYWHGLRASECEDLRWGDLNFESRTINIRRLKGSLQSHQRLREHPAPLWNELGGFEALREMMGEPEPEEFVFHLSRFEFYHRMRRFGGLCGLDLKKCTPHALKHSLAHHLLLANVPISAVQKILGHSSLTSTLKYLTYDEVSAERLLTEALGAKL